MGYTKNEMKAINTQKGHFWFSKGAMEHFNTIIETNADRFGLFISSEEDEFQDVGRKYTVRHFNAETGKVTTVEPHNTMSEWEAKAYIKDLRKALSQMGNREKDIMERLSVTAIKENGRVLQFIASYDADGHADAFDIDLENATICG